MNDPRLFVCRLIDFDYEYLGEHVETYIPRPFVGEVIHFEQPQGRVPYRSWQVMKVVHPVPRGRGGVDLYLLVQPIRDMAL